MKYKLVNQNNLKFSYPCFIKNLSQDHEYIFASTLACNDIAPINLITCRVILKLWNKNPDVNVDQLSIKRY